MNGEWREECKPVGLIHEIEEKKLIEKLGVAQCLIAHT